MKKAIVLALSCLVAGTAARAEETLALYNWGDYINPAVLTKFTEETGIKVTLDTYAANEEMLAKIQAGAAGYDIVFPSVWMQDIMVKLDLLEQTNINADPAFANIDPAFLRSMEDPQSSYCLPYAWGTVGIFYNEKVTGPITGWEDFFAIPQKTGQKITLLDDMREVLGMGLIMTGHSVNSTDPAELKEAADYVTAHKAEVTAFTYESMPLLLSGDVAAAHYFVGGNMFFVDHPEIKYIIPKEGATMYQENICVLKDAPHKAAAQKFLQFYLRPEIAALNVSQQFNGTPNRPANDLTPDFIKSNPNINVPAETMARLQIFADLGKALKLYDRAWNAIRTAQ
ncbi:polyamine ABC transporter substrate-binding protein [Rhodobacter capsulatus]|jgi:spermidine/putrescine transport system substrate-binding protein|uniref:Putrescine-binding periplasmic protein n=1 Tax=Rhodobacter capsulatus (strain ATCC BAA-309 / NBRC 16581 / SB1003) TaxID=272942 RepID=D5AT27_RHOCB|nr:spermidine/putrescine ABC transporter substrate-binding protein [Rhodobacter capsulatus]ADE85134.1 polyamine ABC transporter, periplasmic polyamine-binding protein PotD-2 [Rhodobacter capsulatus SB 1003]ETD02142.1 ABC transporter substrate-binding protein [Rhodobacter capsulatus DE442]ETD77816.1 ABC transporter substrate-binding protein [Rhodobacter capsulatus R121]ETE54174.1 ABC transporter substrate-binding protein [Rhodobacter capsulatus Y262]MDS0926789.1 spermidine/putrescine ABC transp